MGDTGTPGKVDLLLRLGNQQIAYSNALLKGNEKKAQNDLDAADRWFSRFDKSVGEYLESAELFRRYHDKDFEITSVVNTWLNGLSIHSDVLQSKGDLERAEHLRDRQREISERYLEEAGRAEVERGRAASLIGQGRFNEALVALMAARDYFQRHGDDLKQARVTIDMVDLLQWLGDCERARTQLNRASEIVESRLREGPPTAARILESVFGGLSDIASGAGDGSRAINAVELYRIATELDYYKGLIDRANGDYDSATHYFLKVLPEYAKMGVGPAIEYQIAACELGEGNAAGAYDKIRALEGTFMAGGLLRQKLAALLRVEAEALIALARPGEALDKLQIGIADLGTYYDPDLLWRLQWQNGVALEALDRDEEALAAYEEAADTVDSLRKAPLGYRLDNTYLADKGDLFRAAIALACRRDEGGRCARLIEMIKSRALTATMSTEAERPPSGDLGARIDGLTRDLDRLEYKGFQEGNAQAYRAERQRILTERAELIERARATDPRWRALTGPVPFDLEAIQSVLRSRQQAALTLYRDGNSMVSVLITASGCATGLVELSTVTTERLRTYAESMETDEQDSVLNDVSAYLAIGARHFIPESLLDKALAQESLVVVPHGLLHLLPWAGLKYRGKRLFEYCPVGILPNLACLVTLDAALGQRPALAVIGAPDYGGGARSLSPLPSAATEIDGIAQHYGAEGRRVAEPKVGAEARESAFWDLVASDRSKAAILHTVCHGVPEAFEPLNAGLLLADGKVDAAEISSSRVRYDEVVLSACSTGWRPVKVGEIELHGDDILGLPGAFLEAGARSVLVSIPKANDAATAAFMTIYHGHRAKGETPLASLRKTQLEMLERSDFKPFMWLGITAYGCQ